MGKKRMESQPIGKRKGQILCAPEFITYMNEYDVQVEQKETQTNLINEEKKKRLRICARSNQIN